MADMTIAAVIPLYNGAKFIQEALASILAQTLPPDEIVVVDDGSTDDGPKIVEDLAKIHPIKLLRKPNGGQSSARNFGVANSSSLLIAFLDQDDKWYPHHLAILIEPFRETRGIPLGWVYSDLDMTDEDGRMLVRGYLQDPPIEHPKRHLRRCMGEDMHVLPSASLISRSAYEAVGGFDERLSGYEDDDFFLRIFAANYDNVFIDRALSQWRMNSTSSSQAPKMVRSSMIYARKLIDQFPEHASDVIAPRFRHALLSRYLNCPHHDDRHREIMKGLEYIEPHLRRRARTKLKMLMPILRHPRVGRAALSARSLVRRLIY